MCSLKLLAPGALAPSPRDIWLVQTPVLRFAEAWDEWKAETGYLDFTDMIETCLRERIPPPVDFDVMFLDETQDSAAASK
jgi:hypothetical protein